MESIDLHKRHLKQAQEMQERQESNVDDIIDAAGLRPWQARRLVLKTNVLGGYLYDAGIFDGVD